MLCAGETTLTFLIMYFSPLKPKSCAFHNFDTLRHILIMYGGNEEEDQYACPVQERQLSLSSSLCS